MLYKEILTRQEKIILYTLDVLQNLVQTGVLPKEIWTKNITINSRKTKRVLKKFNITESEIRFGCDALIVEGFINKKVLMNHFKTMPDSFIKELEMYIN